MRHQVKKIKLGLPRDQRKLLLGNLATSLVMHEKIQTTKAKAKVLQPFFEKLVVASKNVNKREAIRAAKDVLQTEVSSKKLVDDLSKRYQDKTSGFTRITNIGFRAGDAAPLVQIELV